MKRFFNSFKKIKNWRKFWNFYYSAKKSPKDLSSFNAILRSGLNAEIPPVLISAFDDVFLKEVYKSNFSTLKKEPVILDIGANVGYFSLYIYSKFPSAKVIAFEPIPSNFQLLERHKNKNNLYSLINDNRAVLGEGNFIDINYNDNLDYTVGASILERNTTTTSIKVPVITIPEIFHEYEMDHCDLLKIDCEGAEYNILFNCPTSYLNKISNMVVEVHHWVPESEGTIEGLIFFLKERNFRVKNNNNEILWCWK